LFPVRRRIEFLVRAVKIKVALQSVPGKRANDFTAEGKLRVALPERADQLQGAAMFA
jgi:hypothetical protein